MSILVPQAPPASGANITMPITDTTHAANTNMLNFDDTGAGSSTLDNSGNLNLTPGIVNFSGDTNISRLQQGLLRMTSAIGSGTIFQIFDISTGPSILQLFRTSAATEFIRLMADQAGNQYTLDHVSVDAGTSRPFFIRRSVDNGATFINEIAISGGSVSVGGSLTAAGAVLTNNGQTQIQGANSTPPAGTMSLLFGTGVPNAGNGNNGDFYLRQDGVAGSRIYHKESGTWVASSA